MGCSRTGAGACCFAIPAVGRFYKHDSPYTYFTSKELHLGEISLECSRAGAAAVALWATQRLLPLEAGWGVCPGAGSRDGRRRWSWIGGCGADERFEALAAGGPELDIVVWKMRAATAERASELATIDFCGMCAGAICIWR